MLQLIREYTVLRKESVAWVNLEDINWQMNNNNYKQKVNSRRWYRFHSNYDIIKTNLEMVYR